MARRRSLQIISTLADSFGGPAVGARELRIALAAIDIDARIVATAQATAQGGNLSAEERARIAGKEPSSTVWLDPAPPRGLERGRWSLWNVAREVRRAEFVHIHGQHRWIHISAALALAIWKRPYGLQPHGSLEPFQLGRSALKKKLFDLAFGRRLIRHASYVMFASTEESERVVSVPATKKVVIPLGAALEAPLPVPQMDNILKISAQDRVVLYLGRLTRKKQPELLLRAWSRVRSGDGAVLVIAGPADDIATESLERLISSLGITESVRLLGEVRGPVKSGLLARCDTFILPSLNENFAIAVAEAMLSGAYCIVSDQVAAREHVIAAKCGMVVQADDEGAWVNALHQRLGEQPNRRREIAAATDYANEHFSWERVARTLVRQWDGVS